MVNICKYDDLQIDIAFCLEKWWRSMECRGFIFPEKPLVFNCKHCESNADASCDIVVLDFIQTHFGSCFATALRKAFPVDDE